MNSRERVYKALKRDKGQPDRTPLQFDLCKSLIEHFSDKHGIPADYTLSYYEDLSYRISANALRTKMGSDCIVVGGEQRPDFVSQQISENISTNEFGMHMKPSSLYVEVVKCPLEDLESTEQLEAYEFPDAYAPGRFTKAARDIKELGSEYFIIGDVEISIFELAWHLTGLEKYLIDFITEEEWISLLNDKVENWTYGLAEQLVRLGVDAIWFGEDLGSQTSTLISPEVWREEFKPRYVRMIEKLKKINPDLIIIMHSDGAVAPLLDDFIEMGIEVYNPVQQNVPGSDPQALKDKYGDKISFFGGVDQQEILPKGDCVEIKKTVENLSRILGQGGGYLLAPAHIIQADVKPESVECMIQAALKE